MKNITNNFDGEDWCYNGITREGRRSSDSDLIMN
jgi:hypothetical protein